MSTDSRALPVFGKRSSDEIWARAQQHRRELAVCPWRFSLCVALLVGAAFLLLLQAVDLIGTGGPRLLAGLLVLMPAACLAQCAFAVFSLAVDAQPLVTLDAGGIAVMSRSGEAEMAWEEVARMGTLFGCVRLDRRPGAVPRLCMRAAFEKSRVRVPALLVQGGMEAFKEAVAEVRPDIARRFWS